MSFADRMERALEEHQSDPWDAHERGDHKDSLDHDCPQCQREMREGLDREGDPAFNGAFNAW